MGEPGQPLVPCPHCRAAHPEEILICPNTNRVLPLEGRLLDNRFRFISQLGEGGMSTVWMAENQRVRKHVAIKLLHPEFARNARTLDRFQNEATAAGRIGNPHICDILDLGESPLGPYIVMEMLSGQSFGELLDTQGRIDPPLAVLIIREALTGLIAAHAASIIHRDLKPENVFIHEPEPGRMLVKLMDFGISKFADNPGGGRTGANVIMGTPEYMSPEQAAGAANVDARTDIWAMGVMLYRALTGVEPFRGNTMAALLLALSTDDHAPIDSYLPEVDRGLSATVDRCLAKEAEQRFATAQQLYDALAPYQQLVAEGERPAAPVRTGRTMAFIQGQAPQTPQGNTPTTGPMEFRRDGPGARATTPSLNPAELVETASQPAPRQTATGSGAQTWSTELSGAPGADQSWSMGKNSFDGEDGAEYRRERRRRSGGWIGLVLLVLLLLAGGGGAWAWSQGMLDAWIPSGDDAQDSAAAASEAGDTDTGTDSDPSTSPAPDLGAETSSETDSSTSGDGDGDAETSGASGASTDSDSAGGSEDSAAGSEGGDNASSDSDSAGASEGSDSDSDSDSGGGGSNAPKSPVMSKLVETGGLYTHKSPGPNGDWATAKNYCRGLKRKKRHNLSKWRLAKVSEIAKFRGTEVKNLLYWSSEGAGDKAKTMTMMSGQISERSTSDPSPRAFCVSRR